MNDDYKKLENFIIAATNDLQYYWTMKNGYLWQTKFVHEQDRFRRINISFEFNDDVINILFDNTKIKHKLIQVNVDKVPNLMSYLADKQNCLVKKEKLQKILVNKNLMK